MKKIRIQRGLFLGMCLAFGFVQYVSSASLSEMYTILSMYIQNPAQTGEVAPFSQATGDELAAFVGVGDGKYYLEAGGGTGATTFRILKKLRSCDHLDVIEINPEMCVILKKHFEQYSNVTVHCCSILDWKPAYRYDAIISTLPFMSLGLDFAQQTMAHFYNLVEPEGIVSYVEYSIVKTARSVVQGICFNKNSFMRTDVQDYTAGLKKQYLKDSKTIYLNIPPVTVYHLCFNT